MLDATRGCLHPGQSRRNISVVAAAPQETSEQVLNDVDCTRDACFKAFLDRRNPKA